ncbi:MAG: HPr family phosphocarrier protein [Actinomycetota bacterium]
MLERSLVVKDEVGLHARPAAAFVREANKFSSDIRVILGEKKANAKSILDVLSLDAGQNAKIRISAEGDDAERALDALQGLLNKSQDDAERASS